MKVLIVDAFSTAHVDALRKLGLEVDYRPDLKVGELPNAIVDANILIARSKEVKRDAIEKGAQLSLIVRAGAGVNTIDRACASERGVFLANCPGKNSIAVAELTMALLLALDRRIVAASDELHSGRWNKKEFSRAEGLCGRTLGIVGLGSIGLEVARRAQAFGMQVIAWSRSLDQARAEKLGVVFAPTVEALCNRVDAISLHVALNKETRGLLGQAELSKLKPGAMLINTSRAEVIDAAALKRAIEEKGLRVALDVFFDEPSGGTGAFADEIGRLPNVVATPHIGASTEQAQQAVADETVRIVRAFVTRGEVPNCVNLAAHSSATHQLTVRHRDQVGVLAEVLGAIRRHALNVEEMSNTIFESAAAASARIRLSDQPPPELIAELSQQASVLAVDCIEL